MYYGQSPSRSFVNMVGPRYKQSLRFHHNYETEQLTLNIPSLNKFA